MVERRKARSKASIEKGKKKLSHLQENYLGESVGEAELRLEKYSEERLLTLIAKLKDLNAKYSLGNDTPESKIERAKIHNQIARWDFHRKNELRHLGYEIEESEHICSRMKELEELGYHRPFPHRPNFDEMTNIDRQVMRAAIPDDFDPTDIDQITSVSQNMAKCVMFWELYKYSHGKPCSEKIINKAIDVLLTKTDGDNMENAPTVNIMNLDISKV